MAVIANKVHDKKWHPALLAYGAPQRTATGGFSASLEGYGGYIPKEHFRLFV